MGSNDRCSLLFRTDQHGDPDGGSRGSGAPDGSSVRRAELDLSYRLLGAIYWSIGDHKEAISAYEQVQGGSDYSADVKDIVAQIQGLQSKLEQIQNLNN